MRKNEYESLEQFTSQYVGEWNPSGGHWFGLDFMYRRKEYRFHTGCMYDEPVLLPDGKEVLFSLYRKKEYKKETNAQRTKNLKRLRENIAKLSLSDFAKETGKTKNDLSMLENGEKTLSLFHIQAYKKFFLEKYTINLSVDYIMGYTDIMENNNLDYQREIGL